MAYHLPKASPPVANACQLAHLLGHGGLRVWQVHEQGALEGEPPSGTFYLAARPT